MDQKDAVALYLNQHHLHEHREKAPLEERVAALRHVKSVIAAARRKRDAAVADAEPAVPAARARVAAARQELAAAQVAERDAIARIDSADTEHATARTLDMRLGDYPDRQAEGVLMAGAAAGA